MNTTEFHILVEQLFNNVSLFIDNYVEQHDTDIDYQISGNVLTVSFENGSRIIINTQEPLSQIWLATPKQGYHFDYKGKDWICNRSLQSFDTIFQTALKLQSA